MATSAASVDLTKVDTTQQYPLGMIVERHPLMSHSDTTRLNAGVQHWVYVYNDEASTAFAQGEVIIRDTGTVTYDGIRCNAAVPAVRVLGVAQHAVAAGSYGWILKKGVGEIQVGDTGTDGLDDALVTIAGVGVDIFADGEAELVIGLGLEDAGGVSGNLITAWINCPG